jgi:hypothetical protein
MKPDWTNKQKQWASNLTQDEVEKVLAELNLYNKLSSQNIRWASGLEAAEL